MKQYSYPCGHRLEALEARTLLSAGSIAIIASLPLNHTVNGPIAQDPAGNLFGTTYGDGANGDGTVFEIAHGTSTVTTIASFNISDGNSPDGLISDSAGNLFGECSGAIHGVIFEIAHGAQTMTTLVKFNRINGFGGSGITLDALGNLFGFTTSGGPHGYGTVFELARDSDSLTMLASFRRRALVEPSSLVLDTVGDVFGIANRGSIPDNNVIFEIAHGSGRASVLTSFNASGDARWYPTGALALDSSGDVFGTSEFGGDGGTIYELTVHARTITMLASFNGDDGEFPSGLTIDSSGNLFGDTAEGGLYGEEVGWGTLFELPHRSNTIVSLLSFNGTDGTFPSGGVVLEPNGDLLGPTAGGTADDRGDNFPSNVFEFTPAKSSTTTVSATLRTKGHHQILTFTATVAPTPAGNLTGTVQFQIDGKDVGSPVPVTSETATYSIATLPIGIHSITALYSGGGSYPASASPVFTQDVGISTLGGVVERPWGRRRHVPFARVAITLQHIGIHGRALGSPVTTTTNRQGLYVFDSVAPGRYRLSEALRRGYHITRPRAGFFTLDLSESQNLGNLNFCD